METCKSIQKERKKSALADDVVLLETGKFLTTNSLILDNKLNWDINTLERFKKAQIPFHSCNRFFNRNKGVKSLNNQSGCKLQSSDHHSLMVTRYGRSTESGMHCIGTTGSMRTTPTIQEWKQYSIFYP